MKKYEIGMNSTGEGGRWSANVIFTVQADSEFDAQRIAEARNPGKKVCYIKPC